MSKALKKLNNWLKTQPFILVWLGLFIFFIGASHYYSIRVLSFSTPPVETQDITRGEMPTQINIPSIKVDLALETGTIKNGVWQISYHHPTFLDSSARPETNGNIVIYGHNKKTIFGNLPYLKLGEKIYIKTTDNKIHIYEVYKKDFVRPNRIDLISPTNYEELTIYTCWGLFDSQRVVIKAKPIVAS